MQYKIGNGKLALDLLNESYDINILFNKLNNITDLPLFCKTLLKNVDDNVLLIFFHSEVDDIIVNFENNEKAIYRLTHYEEVIITKDKQMSVVTLDDMKRCTTYTDDGYVYEKSVGNYNITYVKSKEHIYSSESKEVSIRLSNDDVSEYYFDHNKYKTKPIKTFKLTDPMNFNDYNSFVQDKHKTIIDLI